MTKGGFPVIAETTLNHIFSKEISQVILAATGLAPNFYCKNCLRVVSAMRGNPPLGPIIRCAAAMPSLLHTFTE